MRESTVFLKRFPWSILAFTLFLFSLTLSVRKVFFVFSPDGSSAFNEYTDVSLYLSDVALLLFLLSIILENKYCILSINAWKEMFHVEQWKWVFVPPLPFLIWMTLSALWAKSPELSIYSVLRLWEGYALFLGIVFFFVPRGTKKEKEKQCSTWNKQRFFFRIMIVLGVFQSVIGFFQFLKQGSLGLTFLKESVFSVTTTGTAKLIFLDQALIRPYGLFLHPNILAGFLGITILFTMLYPLLFHRKMFHVEQSGQYQHQLPQNVPRGTKSSFWKYLLEQCSTWNNRANININFLKMFHVEQSVWWYRSILCIQVFVFLITFSKAALLSLGLTLLYLIHQLFHVEHSKVSSSGYANNVPRGTFKGIWLWICKQCSTWNNRTSLNINFLKMFHVEQGRGFWLFITGGVLVIFIILSLDWYYFIIQPVQERLFLMKELFAVTSQKPFIGIGMGQSVLALSDFFSEKLLSWQFQPVHNMYLLILIEGGVVGLFFFCFALFQYRKMFHVEQSGQYQHQLPQNVPRGTKQFSLSLLPFQASLLYLFLVSFFDHYVWDIEPTRMLLWLLLGMLVASHIHFHRGIDK